MKQEITEILELIGANFDEELSRRVVAVQDNYSEGEPGAELEDLYTTMLNRVNIW
jgi:hypothetical protein